ncbi:MAG: DUF805 domain-containing protein [Flavobacteriaceae bacterium]|nr:DUF805 domain-containing protein [Flavobacteriaceae bacterium]
MFKNPFSFEGRIRRTEYGLSILIYTIAYITTIGIIGAIGGEEAIPVLFIILIPMLWFIWAQGAKRCHDLGNSGFWQLIPFYGLWLLFQEGQRGRNEYGEDPKENNAQYQKPPQTYQGNTGGASSSSTYQGGYNGGHNNPNTINDSTRTNTNQTNSGNQEGYKDGDLYN